MTDPDFLATYFSLHRIATESLKINLGREHVAEEEGVESFIASRERLVRRMLLACLRSQEEVVLP
jgi:hypothetical protein